MNGRIFSQHLVVCTAICHSGVSLLRFIARMTWLETNSLILTGPLYDLRFRLPKTLPPTFKGVAVRYVYTLQATAQFAPPKPFTPSTSMPLSSSASLADASEVTNPFAAAAAADKKPPSNAGLCAALGSG